MAQITDIRTARSIDQRIAIYNALSCKTVPFESSSLKGYIGHHDLSSNIGFIRSIPTWVLYDDKGLFLFDKITYLEEYYLTNAEIEIFVAYAKEMVQLIPTGAVLIELGAGAMRKTRYLLQEVLRQNKNINYYALDLSEQSLKDCLEAMIKEFPTLNVRGLLGTYEDCLEYIQTTFPRETQKMFLWLGSSIGNMTRPDAARFLHSVMEKGMALGDFFLCGIDRRKDAAIVKLAYDDPYKLTEAFIMNGLQHVNHIFDSEAFDVSQFEYISIYNSVLGRHEAYFLCLKDIAVTLRSFSTIYLKKGELINIEYSYKYTKAEVDQLVDAHFYHVGQWTDTKAYYDLHLFQKPPFHFEQRSQKDSSIPSLHDWEQLWAAWNTVIDTIPHEKVLEQPIPLRHPFIFYIGHIPGFLDLHLHKSLGVSLSHPTFPKLFERGIDPDVDNPTSCHEHSPVPEAWPDLREVKKFSNDVQLKLLNLMKGSICDDISEVLWMTYEHQAMHLETIMYMLIQSEGILFPLAISAPLQANSSMTLEQSLQYVNEKQYFYTSEAGVVDMGINQGLVWDNERPGRIVPVASYKVSQFNVTNVEYYEFWRLNEYQKDLLPALWSLGNSSGALEIDIWVKTVHRSVLLQHAALWPVFVSFEQAEAYANWKKMRLLSEVECRKLMKDRQDQGHDNLMSNIGFKSWAPQPIAFLESHGAPALTGDAWEWTSSIFEPHEGFEPGILYPNYSKDFFDGKHNVLVGGSWATVPRIALRPTFRNYYHKRYPFLFAKFRLAQ